MPIYEYRCEACGHTLDALQKISDAPLTDCPACSESTLKRLISAPAFRLKGSGWYETDFKSDKEKKRNLVESASSGSEGKSAEGEKSKESTKAKAEDKPAKKAADQPKKSSGGEAA